MPSKIKDEKAGVVLTCRQHHRRQLAARARLLPRQHTSPISAFARQNMWKDGCKRGLLRTFAEDGDRRAPAQPQAAHAHSRHLAGRVALGAHGDGAVSAACRHHFAARCRAQS